MSENGLQVRFKLNFPMIFIMVLFAHLCLMAVKQLPTPSITEFSSSEKHQPIKLDIRKVRTAKSEHSMVKAMDSVIDPGAAKPSRVGKGLPNLSDLGVAQAPSMAKPPVQAPKLAAPKLTRPGTRPEVKPIQVREMSKVSMKSKEFQDFSKSFPSGGLAMSDMLSGAQKISDAVVSIEVPEGVHPDELNQYELMFYGFQKRTSVAYLNSILSNLNKFQKRYPNYKVPKEGTITMTARISYDRQGNVKQIKMVRWTNVNEMQGLFEDIVKGIDQLHNPPKVLWEKDDEFAMFYTLQIVNG